MTGSVPLPSDLLVAAASAAVAATVEALGLPTFALSPLLVFAASRVAWRGGVRRGALAAGVAFVLYAALTVLPDGADRITGEWVAAIAAQGAALLTAAWIVGARRARVDAGFVSARREADTAGGSRSGPPGRHVSSVGTEELLERYRLIGRATNDTIWDWDIVTNKVIFNEAAHTMFRYEAEEVGGEEDWISKRIHPEDRDRVRQGFERVFASGEDAWSDEYRFRRGDGSYAVVHDRGYIARDEWGRPVRMVGSMRDITEERCAQERQRFLAEASRALAASPDYEEMLHTLARLPLAGFADYCAVDIVDSVGVLRRIEAGHRLAEKDELIRELNRRYPPTPHSRPTVAGVFTSGESALFTEFPREYHEKVAVDDEHLRLLRAVGIRSAMVVPIMARGRTHGVLTLAVTESDRRYGPEDLALAEDLASRAALMLDNARLLREAQQASRAKSEFLAVISHEFRTPLMAVIGYADLLAAEIAGPINAAQLEKLDHIRSSAWHLSGLIEEILIFARLEAGRVQVRHEPVDVAAMVRDAVALVEPAVGLKPIEFRVRLLDGPLEIRTDPSSLRRILLNLLSNAVKFTDEGAIEVAGALADGALVLEIKDTGIGIDAQHLPQLFDPFWQVDQSPTRRAGGTGLGLTVTRRLARVLGGDVEVESTPGRGSTFRVRIPTASPTTEGQIIEVAAGAGISGAGHRVGSGVSDPVRD